MAALLSVQCRDAVALQATRRLQAALGGCISPAAVAAASLEEIVAAVSCCNFKHTKAGFVKAVADAVLSRFGGVTPRSLASLESLPGVGPKLSRLISSVAFPSADSCAGIVVDTHVHRVAGRLGWASTGGVAETTRVRLEAWLPESHWDALPLLFIGLGQDVCLSAKPRCGECPLRALCPSSCAKPTVPAEEPAADAAAAADDW